MSIKEEALRRIGELPDDCTWMDVLRAAAAGAGGRVVALTESPEEREALHGAGEPPAIELGGWCVGPIPIDLSQAPPPLAEMMVRVRDAVERCLGTIDFHPPLIEPDPRKLN